MIEKDKLKAELTIVKRKLKRLKEKKKDIDDNIKLLYHAQYHFQEDVMDLECDIQTIKRLIKEY